jgi:cytochrome P450
MTVDDTAARPSTEGIYWDPWDYDLHADSHPVWRRMREEAPLYRNEKYDFWALTRFQDVLDVLVDWKTYSSAHGDIIEVIRGGLINEYTRSLISEGCCWPTSTSTPSSRR